MLPAYAWSHGSPAFHSPRYWRGACGPDLPSTGLVTRLADVPVLTVRRSLNVNAIATDPSIDMWVSPWSVVSGKDVCVRRCALASGRQPPVCAICEFSAAQYVQGREIVKCAIQQSRPFWPRPSPSSMPRLSGRTWIACVPCTKI